MCRSKGDFGFGFPCFMNLYTVYDIICRFCSLLLPNEFSHHTSIYTPYIYIYIFILIYVNVCFYIHVYIYLHTTKQNIFTLLLHAQLQESSVSPLAHSQAEEPATQFNGVEAVCHSCVESSCAIIESVPWLGRTCTHVENIYTHIYIYIYTYI